jgi:hypothetical protein
LQYDDSQALLLSRLEGTPSQAQRRRTIIQSGVYVAEFLKSNAGPEGQPKTFEARKAIARSDKIAKESKLKAQNP